MTREATALVSIDIQNDYFPGGRFPLEGAAEAAERAAGVITALRSRQVPVVHIRHESVVPGSTFFLPGTPGADIHPLVAPLSGEAVVTKQHPNAFRETGLEALLRKQGIRHLLVCGMMSLMCVDATARAAADLGFQVTVLHDACAARALSFQGVDVSAAQVHAAFMAALAMRPATLCSCAELLARL